MNRLALSTLLSALGLIFLTSGTIVTSSSSFNSQITQPWVNQELVSWKPQTTYPMGFGAVLST
ncbi:MAG: hypothetical protein ACREBS_12100, partial [Nitrososphaerales archaeon]